MLVYTLRRIGFYIPVLLGVVLLLMFILRLNDAVIIHLGKNPDAMDIKVLREQWGLDTPFILQYFSFLKQIFLFDFSEQSRLQPGWSVSELLSRSLWPTLSITLPALVISHVSALCLAMIAICYKNSWFDRLVRIGSSLGMSTSYLVYIAVAQTVLAYGLSTRLGFSIFAVHGYESGVYGWIHYCLLPVIVAVSVGTCYDTFFFRMSFEKESQADYISTARAKGLSEWLVISRHMFAGVSTLIITRFMSNLPLILLGSVLLEKHFGIPGMGGMLVDAVLVGDLMVVQCFGALFCVAYVLSLLATDVLYAWLHPHIQLA